MKTLIFLNGTTSQQMSIKGTVNTPIYNILYQESFSKVKCTVRIAFMLKRFLLTATGSLRNPHVVGLIGDRMEF